MRFSNYHTHTSFCDGNDRTEELVIKAIQLGCPEIGFSGHSFTWFDQSYCMSPKDIENYEREIMSLKEKYRGRIKILLGIEQDFYSDEPAKDFDYVIGSVHYVLKDGEYLPVDENRQLLSDAAKNYYGGDFYAFAEDYFETVGRIYEKTGCNIIGHFDLFGKFNGCDELFDTKHPRYRRAVSGALERLKYVPAFFEVNMGGMIKGYKKEPYPQRFILEEINAFGGKVILSSDCHDKETLLYGFDEAYRYLLNCGFDSGRICRSMNL